jgi:hypothetical protein
VRRLAILALTLIVLASGSALAGGRAACRAEFGLEARLACYAEEVVWGVGPLELAVGLEYRSPGSITPYTALAYYDPAWWIALEIGHGIPGAWRWAIGAGVRW